MNDDYGLKMTQALGALRQMYADVSKLLVDADGSIGKGKASVFGSTCIRGLSQSYSNPNWMPWCVYRWFADAGGTDPGLVEGVTAWFWDGHGRIAEPHLLVGQIRYELGEGQQLKLTCHEWDLVLAYAEWVGERVPGTVLCGRCPRQKPAVSWFKVIGSPLFSINSMNDVVALMELARAAGPQPAG